MVANARNTLLSKVTSPTLICTVTRGIHTMTKLMLVGVHGFYQSAFDRFWGTRAQEANEKLNGHYADGQGTIEFVNQDQWRAYRSVNYNIIGHCWFTWRPLSATNRHRSISLGRDRLLSCRHRK